MKIISCHSLVFLSSISFFFSCAKKTQPDTVHNVNSSNQSDASSSSDNFNSGLNNDFADLGTPINGSFDDGLSERDPSLSAFNDESASRPFEPVLFGFDQYNINATERNKISRIADYLKDIHSMIKDPHGLYLVRTYTKDVCLRCSAKISSMIPKRLTGENRKKQKTLSGYMSKSEL